MRAVKPIAWIVALGVVGLAASGAFAADAGWGLQFHYEAFEDATYPVAVMQEQTDGMSFDAANLFIACHDSQPALFWQSGQLKFDAAPETVRFRGSEGPVAFEFKSLDFVPFGKHLAIEGPDAQSLLGIFSSATGLVPYQTEAKSGNFQSAGFDKVLAIMASECATF